MAGRALFTIALLVKIISAGHAPPPAGGGTLERLEWMAGSWASDSAGTRIEEHWTDPGGGVMVGMHRDVTGGRATSWEFLRIEGDSTGMRYVAQPKGRPAATFAMKQIGDRAVTFENPARDFPRRISYWLDAAGALHARVEGRIGSRATAEEWRWERIRLGE